MSYCTSQKCLTQPLVFCIPAAMPNGPAIANCRKLDHSKVMDIKFLKKQEEQRNALEMNISCHKITVS